MVSVGQGVSQGGGRGEAEGADADAGYVWWANMSSRAKHTSANFRGHRGGGDGRVRFWMRASVMGRSRAGRGLGGVVGRGRGGGGAATLCNT